MVNKIKMVKCKTIKALDLRGKVWIILGMRIVYQFNTKGTIHEEIIDKLDFINILKLLLCKRHYQENGKTSHIHWKKIFAKDKGL